MTLHYFCFLAICLGGGSSSSSSGQLNDTRLYTICVSHFNELARWALQVNNVSFNEESYLPGFHKLFPPIERLRKKQNRGSTGRGTSLPLLDVHGTIYGDSWSILEFAFASKNVPAELKGNGALKMLLDQRVGPQARSIA